MAGIAGRQVFMQHPRHLCWAAMLLAVLTLPERSFSQELKSPPGDHMPTSATGMIPELFDSKATFLIESCRPTYYDHVPIWPPAHAFLLEILKQHRIRTWTPLLFDPSDNPPATGEALKASEAAAWDGIYVDPADAMRALRVIHRDCPHPYGVVVSSYGEARRALGNRSKHLVQH